MQEASLGPMGFPAPDRRQCPPPAGL